MRTVPHTDGTSTALGARSSANANALWAGFDAQLRALRAGIEARKNALRAGDSVAGALPMPTLSEEALRARDAELTFGAGSSTLPLSEKQEYVLAKWMRAKGGTKGLWSG